VSDDGKPSGAGALLRRNAAFRALWLSRTTSFIGDALGTIALLLYVVGADGRGVTVALLFLAVDFAPSLLSPLSGALSDRVDRKRLMIGCDLAQGAIIASIALVDMPVTVLLGLVAVRSTLGSLFQPASRSSVPDLVRERDLETANAVIGFGTHGFDLIGPLLGAALLPLIGVRGMLFVDAATFLVSAMLLMRLPNLAPVHLDEDRVPFLREAGDGLRFLWRLDSLRVLTIGFCAVVALNGVDDIALVFLAQDVLDGTDSQTSLLYGGAGMGLLVGFLLLARFATRFPVVAMIGAGFFISSLGNAFTGLSVTNWMAFAMQAMRGLGISLIEVSVQTFVQRTVPKGMQGRAFANLFGAVGLSAGLSYAVGGPLIDLAGPRFALAVGGFAGAVMAVLVARRLSGVIRPTTEAIPGHAADATEAPAGADWNPDEAM
jgi:MFS family permease